LLGKCAKTRNADNSFNFISVNFKKKYHWNAPEASTSPSDYPSEIWTFEVVVVVVVVQNTGNEWNKKNLLRRPQNATETQIPQRRVKVRRFYWISFQCFELVTFLLEIRCYTMSHNRRLECLWSNSTPGNIDNSNTQDVPAGMLMSLKIWSIDYPAQMISPTELVLFLRGLSSKLFWPLITLKLDNSTFKQAQH